MGFIIHSTPCTWYSVRKNMSIRVVGTSKENLYDEWESCEMEHIIVFAESAANSSHTRQYRNRIFTWGAGCKGIPRYFWQRIALKIHYYKYTIFNSQKLSVVRSGGWPLKPIIDGCTTISTTYGDSFCVNVNRKKSRKQSDGEGEFSLSCSPIVSFSILRLLLTWHGDMQWQLQQGQREKRNSCTIDTICKVWRLPPVDLQQSPSVRRIY